MMFCLMFDNPFCIFRLINFQEIVQLVAHHLAWNLCSPIAYLRLTFTYYNFAGYGPRQTEVYVLKIVLGTTIDS